MILTLSELKEIASSAGLVLACGCFDVLTIGHVRHLKTASCFGWLCVLVTADRHVNKPGRPIFPEGMRAEVIDALKAVSYTIVNPHPTAVEAIRFLQPQVYVKGGEYDGKLTPQLKAEKEALDSYGGKLVFTGGMEVHTTDVLERLGI